MQARYQSRVAKKYIPLGYEGHLGNSLHNCGKAIGDSSGKACRRRPTAFNVRKSLNRNGVGLCRPRKTFDNSAG
jgi:hypothetical protein